MIRKLKLANREVVFQNDKITKVDITISYPALVYDLYIRLNVGETTGFLKPNCPLPPITFSGIARKGNDDTFDPEVGVSIAEARAWMKAKKFYAYMLKCVHNSMFAFDQDVVETAEDVESDIEHNREYIARK